MLALAVLAPVSVWLIRSRKFTWGDIALRGVLPALAVLASAVLAMGAQFNLLAVLFTYRYISRIPGDANEWAHHRNQIQRQLESTPGRHLILVRYSPTHVIQDE